ncbi:hypothetical protein [Saccharophagus degradans]|uniref:Uncharacterized protein n=1 Tax=Saccharophagus degradans TaxID=86304 RepID=A0AAW7X313_9GAMM|nr:hypothetical protein [Saccharophagus degradans]MDO6421685.1 hypothetical protein [Saccharophagus degradans]MDO6609805.1 hypothetical protein [Saccharophagus degradans]
MKYKNINSAIHNFGHSFTSYENYVDNEHVLYELKNIRRKGYDIHINWITREFSPAQLESDRIKKSISYWAKGLKDQFESLNVNLECIKELDFYWPANEQHYIVALDDRGVKHQKEITYAQ